MVNKIVYITYPFQWETNKTFKYSARVFKRIFKPSSFKIFANSESNIYFVSKRRHVNLLAPNDDYSGRAAPLTSKFCILYIYSTNIGTEYFKHGIYCPSFPLQNAVCFIILTDLVPVLFPFYIQGVVKLKKIIPASKGNSRSCKTGGSPSGPHNNVRLLAKDTVYIGVYIYQCLELRKSSNVDKCTPVSTVSYPTRLAYPGSWHTSTTG